MLYEVITYTRWGTVALASFQSVAAASWLQNQAGLVVNPGPSFLITACITLVTGTMFLMWLGEQITERGIGNGISMIILRITSYNVCYTKLLRVM